jgi:hypothetical protein
MAGTSHIGTAEEPVFVGLDLKIGDSVEGTVSLSGDRTKPDNLVELPGTSYWWGRGILQGDPPPNPYVLDQFDGAHQPGTPNVDPTEYTY